MTATIASAQMKNMLKEAKKSVKCASPILHRTYGDTQYSFSVAFAMGQYFVKINFSTVQDGETVMGEWKVPSIHEKSEFAAINYAGKKLINNWQTIR